MRIESLNLPASVTRDTGLEPLDMRKLREVILIAGKNGSGKTRLLNLISSLSKSGINSARLHILYEQLGRNEYNLSEAIRSVRITEDYVNSLKGHPSYFTQKGKLDAEKGLVKQFENAVKRIKDEINQQGNIKYHNYSSNNNIVFFNPKNIDLNDSYLMSAKQISEYGDEISSIGMGNIQNTALATIQLIINKWNDAYAKKEKGSAFMRAFEEIDIKYKKLQSYVGIFLGVGLGSDDNGNATLFGKRIGEANLSDGQRVLLQFCIALYGQDSMLGKNIIFMDEPENHVHPGALIEVIDKILEHIGDGQLWIATHSIHLLAHFDSSVCWYMQNGKLSYAGTGPEQVLEGLLGSQDEIDKLSNYLSLPAKLASENFAYQCLLAPEVAWTGADDPQTKQIQEIISDKIDTGLKLRVLDFGVGKGRLISAMAANEKDSERDIAKWLDYYAFDEYADDADFCKKVLSSIYTDSGKRYFNSYDVLSSKIDDKSLDYIIMCNVFHEIPPRKWNELFNSKISVMNLLKDDGVLLIVEDQFLAIGEKAHSNGFLVFDTVEFQKLFDVKKKADIKYKDFRNDGRLKAHFIPAKATRNVSYESKKAALEILADTSRKKITEIRKSTPSFKNGRLHSFWSQQFANASLAISEL